MPTPNPYQPQSPIKEPPVEQPQPGRAKASRRGAVAAAAVWAALSVLVFVAQSVFGPIFADFKVPLPTVTQWLLFRDAPLWVMGAAVLVVLGAFGVAEGRRRTIFARLAFSAGVLLGLMILAAFLLPLLKLFHDLT